MKIISYQTNKVFSEISKETVFRAVEQTIALIDTARKIISWSVPEAEYVEKNGPVSSFGYTQLDELEGRMLDMQYSALETFAAGMYATSDVLNRRTANGVKIAQQLHEKLQVLTERYIPLNAAELEMLRELSACLIGDMAYFLYYQFNLDTTDKNIKSNEEPEVNILISEWCDLNGLYIKELLLLVKQMMEEYKPSLTIFEEFPELEDVFYDKAGPYAMDLDTYRDYVTVDHILAVVNGTKPIEQVVKELSEIAG